MSDSLGSSFAIGYLAGSYSGAQTARSVTGFVNALRSRNQASIDVNSLVSVIQQMEAHIAQQDGYISDLQTQLESVRRRSKILEEDRNKLYDWAEKAEEELKRWRSGV